MSPNPRDIRRIAASVAVLVVLVAGAAYYATDPAPATTSSTCETP